MPMDAFRNPQKKASRAGRCARLVRMAAICSVVTGGGWGQVVEFRDLLSGKSKGFQLYDVSVYSSYYTSALPFLNGGASGTTSTYLPQTQQFGSDVMSGIGADVGWTAGKQSDFAVHYSFSYNGSVQHPDWSRFNHNLSFRAGRPVKLGRKWSLTYGGSGNVATLQSFLFSEPQAGAVAAAPATFTDFSSAILGRGLSNDQLAAALTGSPIASSGLGELFYGSLMLNASASVGVSYARSPRTTIAVMLSGSRLQPLSHDSSSGSGGQNTSANIPAYASGIGATSGGGVGLSATYALNERTSIGVSISASRAISGFSSAYVTSATGSVGRSFRRWFVHLDAGSGNLSLLRSSFGGSGGIGWMFGASVGTKIRRHTFYGTVTRSIGDSYGIGAQATVGGGGGWSCTIGRGWSVMASFGEQQLRSDVIDAINSWRAETGISHPLSDSMFLNMGYSYFTNFGKFGGLPYQFNSSGVRASISWAPHSALTAARNGTRGTF